MKRQDPSVQEILRELVAELGPSDPRVIEFGLTQSDEAVSHFVASLLADSSLASMSIRRALWLLPLFPTETLRTQLLRTLTARPEFAHIAGWELRKLKDPSLIQELGSVLLDLTVAPESRAEAAGVLGELGDPKGKDFLIRAMRTKEQEPLVVRKAALGLGYLQLLEGSTDAVDELSNLLTSSFPEVRLAALNALSNMWATQAIDKVEALLGDAGITASGEHVGARAAVVSRLLRGARSD
jgi:hypothetical protein